MKVKDLTDAELIEKADKILNKLCETGGKSFTMSIPPNTEDTDIVLDELILRFKFLVAKK